MGKEEIGLPSAGTYICSLIFSVIPKIVVIVFAIIIAAYRTELFSAEITAQVRSTSFAPRNDRDLPLRICFFFDEDDDVYGDRICNNAIASSIISILIAMVLMVIDLQIPCTNSTFARLAHLLNLTWAAVLAVYWIITSALLADLYRRYCDEDETGNDCGDTEESFIILPVFGFVCMGAWIVQAVISFIRLIIGK